MTTFKLPKGYSFDPPADELVNVQGVTIPPFGLYGGSAVTQEWDANGVHFVGCNATKTGDTPPFKWRMFKKKGNGYVEIPLPFLATGRGTQGAHPYDGKAHAIAWEQKDFNFAEVPGFVPFPSIPSLAARIAQLEEVGPSGGGTPRAAIPIPPGGAIARLWPLAYGASEVDTPEKVAVKFNRLKDAMFELIEKLKEAGTLV